MWLLRKEETQNKTTDRKWGLIVMVVFFLSGFAGLIEKIHQSTNGREERTMFLFVAYLIMFAISVTGFLIKKKIAKPSPIKPTILYGGISGIIIGFYAFINLILAGNLDSMIYYPVANGGALLFTVLISIVVFKEKCTVRHITGFAIGFIPILLLSLPL